MEIHTALVNGHKRNCSRCAHEVKGTVRKRITRGKEEKTEIRTTK